MKDKVKIVLVGALGKMGRSILSVSKDYSIKVIGAIDKTFKSEDLGIEINDNSYKGVKLSTNLSDVIQSSDVVIEFSGSVQNVIDVANICKIYKKALVIGTTGFSEQEINMLKEFSKDIPILLSPNMSLGVNLLFKLVEIGSKTLKEKGFDIELLEIHHNQKKDAPSGTAMKLLEIISNETGIKNYVFGREGIKPRQKDEIGVFALRGADVIGEHTIYFFGKGERLELSHKASSREIFARGTLEAAIFLSNKEPGFYSMFDVLGL